MAACGAWSLVRRTPETLTAIPLRCRSWNCPVCAPVQRGKLLRALRATQVDSLLTLTCAPEHFASPTRAWHRLSEAIPLLIRLIRARYPSAEVQYFLVWESTKSGWPHCHLLLRAPYIPQRWLSQQWALLTHAPIVDIRRAHHRGAAAAYLSKYLSKQPSVPPGFRRFRTSLKFWPVDGGPNRKPPPSDHPWYVSTNPTSLLARVFTQLGWSVRERYSGSFEATPPAGGKVWVSAPVAPPPPPTLPLF